VSATDTLQNWYNETTGLWETTGWWNSANVLTMLADLTDADSSSVNNITQSVFATTFENAQKTNLGQVRKALVQNKAVDTDTCYRANCTIDVSDVQVEPKGFLNDLYDDEGWWALAWIKISGLTGQPEYMEAAETIFEDMVSTGANATCGGIWWDRTREHNTAIANELFLSVAAHLANRVEDSGRKAYYKSWALKQWDWFKNSGLINSNNTINDGIDLDSCKNANDTVWSYNQGVILGALVELNRADPGKEGEYISTAKRIASAAIDDLSDDNGILHDPHEPNLGADGPQFKGVFMRNLYTLYTVTNEDKFKQYIQRNAQSIWDNARDEKTGVLGPVWSGPYKEASAASHSSAMDALVAAAAVERKSVEYIGHRVSVL